MYTQRQLHTYEGSTCMTSMCVCACVCVYVCTHLRPVIAPHKLHQRPGGGDRCEDELLCVYVCVCAHATHTLHQRSGIHGDGDIRCEGERCVSVRARVRVC